MTIKKPEITGRKFPETAWIRCDLTKEHKEHLKQQKFDAKACLSAFERLCEDGYKLTFSRDEKNDCVGVFMTAPKDSQQPVQLCLSARGPTLTDAMMAILYKHFEVLSEDWSVHIDNRGQADPWG